MPQSELGGPESEDNEREEIGRSASSDRNAQPANAIP